MVLAHMVGAEAAFLVELDQRQALVILLGQCIGAVVVLVENAELHRSSADFFQGGSFGRIAECPRRFRGARTVDSPNGTLRNEPGRRVAGEIEENAYAITLGPALTFGYIAGKHLARANS